MGTAQDPGFGVYVHWPFCASKCPYCDFNSHVRAGIDEKRWLAAYAAEIAHMATLAPHGIVGSIFFGGGTPSLMQPETVAGILDGIARHWPIAEDVEVTLEANPSSVEAGRFRGYRTAGVNRVSLGVQSLEPVELRKLGRLHSVEEATAAIRVAQSTFERVSFDLIYARPDQTAAAWSQELDAALDLAAGHLSLYQLTIEDGTPYAALHASGKLRIPEGQLAHDLFEVTQDRAAARGLRAYEISNHARPGEEARHNLLYWRYGTYAGIGAGAHGRLQTRAGRAAFSTERSPERWLELVERHGHAIVDELGLTFEEQADEMLLMGMRLAEGLDIARLARVTGRRPSEAAVRSLVEQGLIEELGSVIKATEAGRFVLNAVVLELSRAFVNASVTAEPA